LPRWLRSIGRMGGVRRDGTRDRAPITRGRVVSPTHRMKGFQNRRIPSPSTIVNSKPGPRSANSEFLLNAKDLRRIPHPQRRERREIKPFEQHPWLCAAACQQIAGRLLVSGKSATSRRSAKWATLDDGDRLVCPSRSQRWSAGDSRPPFGSRPGGCARVSYMSGRLRLGVDGVRGRSTGRTCEGAALVSVGAGHLPRRQQRRSAQVGLAGEKGRWISIRAGGLSLGANLLVSRRRRGRDDPPDGSTACWRPQSTCVLRAAMSRAETQAYDWNFSVAAQPGGPDCTDSIPKPG